MSAYTAAKQPFHVMAKGIGPKCNLDCEYCFYLEKEALFGPSERFRMTDETLDNFTRSYIESQPNDSVTFAWQGGEPTLLGVPFFEKAVELQKKYANGKQIENSFQTNGTLIDDRWASVLAENNFLVGVSIDGPEEIHNSLRKDRDGKGSFDKVLKGIRTLQRHKVEWNSLTCVNAVTSKQPQEVYRFLKGIGARFMQFIPIVERKPDAVAAKLGLDFSVPPQSSENDVEVDGPEMMSWSVKSGDYGRFMISIFDKWVREDVAKRYIQLFDVAFQKWLGIPGGLCIFSETCGDAVALEHDGGVYSCDHYVYPEFKLGNLNETPLASMMDSAQQRKFGQDKADLLPKQCRECEYKPACNGGCPKQRFIKTKDGEAGLNYLCYDYFAFFKHVDPYFQVMADFYRKNQAPATIMELIKKKKLPFAK